MNNKTIANHLEKILKLFDVEPVEKSRTNINKDYNHDEICEIIEYWINQTKIIFGEVVWIEKNQGLRDAGVDLYLEFIQSRVKMGFQVKSYNDIKDKDFSRQVDAQITRSHKHKLDYLFVCFAGDLTDNSQEQKIRGKISDFSQEGEYVHTISPEKLAVIIETYREKIHPLKRIRIGLTEVSLFASGLKDALSNDERSVNVTINIKNRDVGKKSEDNGRIHLELAIPEDDLELSNKLELIGSNKLTEPVKISSKYIKGFEAKVFGLPKYSIEDLKEEERNKLTLVISPHKKKHSLDIINFDEKGKELDSLRNLNVKLKITKESIHIKSRIEETVFQVEMLNNKSMGTEIEFGVAIKPEYGNAQQIEKGFKFIETLEKANYSELVIYQEDKEIFRTKLEYRAPKMDKTNPFYQMIPYLSYIEQKTGVNFSFKDMQPNKNEISNILNTYTALKEGKLELSDCKMKIVIPRVPVLEMLYKSNDSIVELDKDTYISQMIKQDILGKEIFLGPMDVKIRKFKILGNREKLIKEFEKSRENIVNIEVEILDNKIFGFLRLFYCEIE